jgi:hypothetical protein
MYPQLRTFLFRTATERFVLLNKFGVHGLNFTTKNFCSYQSLKTLHVDHQFYDNGQYLRHAQRLLDAAVYRQYVDEKQRCALFQIWTIAQKPTYIEKPHDIVIDGKLYATVTPGVLFGRHVLLEQDVQPGYYFVNTPKSFVPYAPGGLHPFDCGSKEERYFAPGRCTRLSLVFQDDKCTQILTTDGNSTPENPLVF